MAVIAMICTLVFVLSFNLFKLTENRVCWGQVFLFFQFRPFEIVNLFKFVIVN